MCFLVQAVPGSRLFLKTKHLGEAAVRQSTVERFAAHGIDANRLILEGAAPRAELLSAYRRVDVALEPCPMRYEPEAGLYFHPEMSLKRWL